MWEGDPRAQARAGEVEVQARVSEAGVEIPEWDFRDVL